MTLPAYYFPSTVFLVDDDALLLSTLQLKLPQHNRYRTSSNPLEALEILKAHEAKQIAPPQFIEHAEQNEASCSVLDLNFKQTLQWLDNPDRFDEISVLIVDYTMPQMNGIELVKQLRDKPFKKILLTGETDQSIAIDAFNAGLIDRYVTKSGAQFPQLIEYLESLQHAYFVDRSKALFNFVATENQIFDTSAFESLFHTFVKKHAISEYYLVNCTGAFLMLNHEKAFYFDLQSENDLFRYTDIAIGNEAPEAIIQKLEQRQSMPVFLSEADRSEPVDNWSLHPITPLSFDNKTLYYTFFELTPTQLDSLKSTA